MKSPCCNIESDIWYDQSEYGKLYTDDDGDIFDYKVKGTTDFQAEILCSKCNKVTKAIVDDNRVIFV